MGKKTSTLPKIATGKKPFSKMAEVIEAAPVIQDADEDALEEVPAAPGNAVAEDDGEEENPNKNNNSISNDNNNRRSKSRSKETRQAIEPPCEKKRVPSTLAFSIASRKG